MSVSEVISNEQVQENKTDLDLSKLRAMVEKLKSTQNLLKLLFYALITFVCVGLPVLYITNRDGSVRVDHGSA